MDAGKDKKEEVPQESHVLVPARPTAAKAAEAEETTRTATARATTGAQGTPGAGPGGNRGGDPDPATEGLAEPNCGPSQNS